MKREITISFPVVIEVYECGPPALEQCPDCTFSYGDSMYPLTRIDDGYRQIFCSNPLNRDRDARYRSGTCSFFNADAMRVEQNHAPISPQAMMDIGIQ